MESYRGEARCLLLRKLVLSTMVVDIYLYDTDFEMWREPFGRTIYAH